MKKQFTLLALAIIASTAFAGGQPQSQGQPDITIHNQPTAIAGAAALAGAAIIDSGNSNATAIGGAATSNATGGYAQGGGGGQAAAQGGNAAGGSAIGGSSANSNNVLFERSAPSVSAQAPVYVRNCRIGIGGGGSNANGSFTAAIPLGNDMTCLVGAKLEAMIQTNLQRPATFSPDTFVQVACDIEGMDTLPECKAVKNRGKESGK